MSHRRTWEYGDGWLDPPGPSAAAPYGHEWWCVVSDAPWRRLVVCDLYTTTGLLLDVCGIAVGYLDQPDELRLISVSAPRHARRATQAVFMLRYLAHNVSICDSRRGGGKLMRGDESLPSQTLLVTPSRPIGRKQHQHCDHLGQKQRPDGKTAAEREGGPMGCCAELAARGPFRVDVLQTIETARVTWQVQIGFIEYRAVARQAPKRWPRPGHIIKSLIVHE